MALKPRTRRRIIWATICLIAATFLAFIIVPPLVSLNSLKPRIQAVIQRQTGIPAEIGGDINFSLLYRATIVAHDIRIPNGDVKRVMFTVPLRYIFNLSAAPLDGVIAVDGARITVDSLSPMSIHNNLLLTNSTVRFLDKDYDIIRGTFYSGRFVGNIRTDQHRYEIDFENDEFTIRNRNNSLEIHGQIYSDGTARGEMSIATDNVNKWFDFSEPKIDRHIDLTMNFDWDGAYGFDFTNIQGNGFEGTIKLYPDGRRYIKLNAKDLDYDLSFLMHPMEMFRNTTFDVDFYGNLKIGDLRFSHLKINATGTANRIQISDIIADSVAITGGYIDADGAHNVMVSMPIDGVPAQCVFSGNTTDWQCARFSWGNIAGTLRMDANGFDIVLNSPDRMPALTALRANAMRLADRGRIEFVFADAAGELKIIGDDIYPSFRFARDKDLTWLGSLPPFIPDFMRSSRGDFTRADTITTFRPTNGDWQLMLNDNGEFMVAGDDFRKWLGDTDLRMLRALPYAIAGRYANGVIADLRAQIANQSFTGRITDDNITLETDSLNLDAIMNPDYIARREEMSFLTPHPLALPFDIGRDISLKAGQIIYDGDAYTNLIYSLKNDTQTLSITDDAHGNILATVARARGGYDIFIQLNRFKISGELLSNAMPLNVRDTRITAEMALHTFGQIAHDIEYNLSGLVDISFDGGYLVGIGLDDFYASAANITRLNAEYALAAAFDGGETRIKKMTIAGKYADGVFDTTSPFTLSVAHADAVGQLQVADGTLAARLRLVMRGTSPEPKPVEIEILGNGKRNYSFTQIMSDFDAGYLRNFVTTHNRF